MRLHKLKNKTHIAVIGGNGFLGRSIITRLAGYDNLRLFSLDKRDHNVNIDTSKFKAILQQINIDVSIAGSVESWLMAHPVDVIIYAAGYENPPDGVWINSEQDIQAVLGLNYVLNSIPNMHLEKNEPKPYFMYISSWAIYGAPTEPGIEFTEDFMEIPTNHCGMARLLAEDLVKRSCNKYNTQYCIVRPTEVYGKHHNNELFNSKYWNGYLAYLVDQVVYRRGKIDIWGLDSQIDLVHVNYFSKVVLNLIQNRSEGIYNICGGNKFTVKELLDKVIDVYGDSKNIKAINEYEDLSVPPMVLSSDKISKIEPYDFSKYHLDSFLKSYIKARRLEIAKNMAIEDILLEPLVIDTSVTEAKKAFLSRKARRKLSYFNIKQVAGPEFSKIKLGRIQERSKLLLKDPITDEEKLIGMEEQKSLEERQRMVMGPKESDKPKLKNKRKRRTQIEQ